MWHRQYIIDSLTANIKVSPPPLLSVNGPLRFKENQLLHEPIMNVRRKERKHGRMTDRMDEQECIPVGCVPPAAVAVGGSPPGTPTGADTPRPGTPQPGTPREQTPPRSRHPP